ncbi:MAG: hypothetical protein QOI21_2524 [Actinomycetota bacterium]|nr:hypothetical protein [Actinomycetota bacterium]
MLTVVEVIPPVDAVDCSDYYIALSLRFRPEAEVGLYCYFEQLCGGSNQGYLEVKVAADTGEIASFVALKLPVLGGDFPADVPVVEGSVRLDLARWADLGDDPRIHSVNERAPITVSRKDGSVYYSFSDVAPERFAVSGSVGFGIGPDNELTGMMINA